MGTMRDNFAAAFVLLVLMLSTSQSFPHGEENSLKRNSLTPKLVPAATTYKCLFVDANMPICDPKWMLGSDKSWDEENTETLRRIRFSEDLLPVQERVDFSRIRSIIVFTFAGCVPPISDKGLRSLMPFCEEIPLNKIVSIQRFRPFAMEGVKKPPGEFPRISQDKWRRQIKRLWSNTENNTGVSKEAPTYNTF
ncbi:uncharacterized protein LOC143185795 [Calliopsis andreniformis]|uniref:uncharacterized protein LOC143185795 n=1 Tax=Calliopsis andreniformis TaxID=337506 RepID=UPI003FCDD358